MHVSCRWKVRLCAANKLWQVLVGVCPMGSAVAHLSGCDCAPIGAHIDVYMAASMHAGTVGQPCHSVSLPRVSCQRVSIMNTAVANPWLRTLPETAAVHTQPAGCSMVGTTRQLVGFC
jgi:hypothetical protein